MTQEKEVMYYISKVIFLYRPTIQGQNCFLNKI